MAKFNEWYETLRDISHELEAVLTGRKQTAEDTPILWSAQDIEQDAEEAQVYAGILITLEDGRKVRITIEPAED